MKNSIRRPSGYFLFFWLILGTSVNSLLREAFGESRELVSFVCIVCVGIGIILIPVMDSDRIDSFFLKLLFVAILIGAISVSAIYLLVKIATVRELAHGVDVDLIMLHTFVISIAMIGPIMYLARK